MNIGYHERSVDDVYPLAVDFDESGIFDGDPATGCTAECDDLTIGTVTLAANVATFQVSGGVAGGTATVTVQATSAGGRVCCVTLTVVTQAC